MFFEVFGVYFHGPFLDQGVSKFVLSPHGEHGVVSVTELRQVGLVLTDQLVERTELRLESLTHRIREGMAAESESSDPPDSKKLAELDFAELGKHEEVDSRLTT